MNTEYHKIETLYERDEKTFKIKPEMILKNHIYGIIKSWVWTEKIDGTNIRVIWKDGKLSFGGKTDNAQIHADLIKWLYENVTPEKLVACFPDGAAVVIYGEGYGAGIQRGGIYGPTKKLIVFDVFVIDTDIEHTRMGGWWLSDENTRDVAGKLGLDAVPCLGEMTLKEAISKGICRVRDPKWSCSNAYFKLDVVDGWHGQWVHFYNPDEQRAAGLKTPQDLLFALIDWNEDGWEEYVGEICEEEKN